MIDKRSRFTVKAVEPMEYLGVGDKIPTLSDEGAHYQDVGFGGRFTSH